MTVFATAGVATIDTRTGRAAVCAKAGLRFEIDVEVDRKVGAVSGAAGVKAYILTAGKVVQRGGDLRSERAERKQVQGTLEGNSLMPTVTLSSSMLRLEVDGDRRSWGGKRIKIWEIFAVSDPIGPKKV